MITEALKHNVKIKQKGKMNITQVFVLCGCMQPSQTPTGGKVWDCLLHWVLPVKVKTVASVDLHTVKPPLTHEASGSLRLTDRSESSFVFRWLLNCAALKAVWSERDDAKAPSTLSHHDWEFKMCQCAVVWTHCSQQIKEFGGDCSQTYVSTTEPHLHLSASKHHELKLFVSSKYSLMFLPP